MRNKSLSQLGFGMLRIDPENSAHRESLRAAVKKGVDLFDLGDFSQPDFQAKLKFVGGSLIESKLPFAQVLVRGKLGCAEDFSIQTKDSRPLNFGQTKVEWIYLIADPDFFPTKLHRELDFLETLSECGALTAYGIASMGLPLPPENSQSLPLAPFLFEDELETKNRLKKRNHFRWIEFPLNLYESEAFTEDSQLDGASRFSLFEVARRWGLHTVVRRPFDAFTEDGLRRLVNYPDHHRLDLHSAVEQTLDVALTLEKSNIEKEKPGPHWAHRLYAQLRYVSDPEHWKEIVGRRIAPELAALRLSEYPPEPKYFDAMEALLLSVRLWCEKSAAERNERLRAALVEAVPRLAGNRRPEDRDLARVSLRVYRSIPELDYVLVGLRSPRYTEIIEDSEPLSREEIQTAFETAYEALKP